MNDLKIIDRDQLNQLISRREGETKFGERVQTIATSNWETGLANSSARFVLIGIPEDIGVRANFGVGGTQTLWQPALKALMNVQETDSLHGAHLLVLGAFDFSEWMLQSEKMSVTQLRDTVAKIDDVVSPVIKAVKDAGKIPIVIGGGHNNAYPIIKGVSTSFGSSINCINLDAHSDYRVAEGRHSGNGFRYAKMEGYLDKYALLGLHRNYNSQAVLNDMQSDTSIDYSFYEDIFLDAVIDFNAAVSRAVKFTSGKPAGVELDLDCIEHTLSSAATPCGISALQARQYVYNVASKTDVAYLHITEGSVKMSDGRENGMTAKLVSYLVTDLIRGCDNTGDL